MKKKVRIILALIIVCILWIIIPKDSYCTDGKLTASVSQTSTKITVTITSSKSLGAFTLKASGANAISATSLAGGDANGNVINGSSTSGAKTLGKFVFSVPSKDTKVTFSVSNCEDADMNAVSIESTFVTLKAKKEDANTDNKDNNTTIEKKSNNANLSTLGVTPKEYDFSGFKKDKTSYSVTVPNDVDSLKVLYRTADSKATVKVTGNTNLEVGTNTIKVVVTAEDGKTTKTYTIKVTKLATEEEKPGNLIDEEEKTDLFLKSLSLEGLDLSPEFASDIYSYTATINMDEKDLSEVKVKAEANNDKATVEITGNTNLVEGENLINVIVKSANSTEQTVYQITVNKISEKTEVVSSNGVLDNVKNIKKEHIIIAGFVFIAIILLIILISIYLRKTTDDDTDEEEIDNGINDEKTSDNLVEELFNKKKNGETLNKTEEETLEDIEKENDRIFNKPKKGETVEYDINENEEQDETSIGEEKEKRKKENTFNLK